MTAPTTVVEHGAPLPRIGFGSALASEWSKLWSVRSTWVIIGLTLLCSIGLAALLGTAIGAAADEPQAQMEFFDPILFSLPGAVFTAILLSVLGVMYVSSEYSSGMIRLTLTATPRRGRILAAKALILGVVTLAIGAVATVGMFLVAQAIFGSYGFATASLGDPDALRAVAGISLTSPVFPLIGLALAFVLRSTAGAITAVIGILFIPDILGQLLPVWWQENVLLYLPAAANDAISLGHIEAIPFALDLVPAVAVVAGWVAVSVLAAVLSLTRRDA